MYSLECHHGHIYKRGDGWLKRGGGGVFKVKSSDLANVYVKFNIGLEHPFSKTQPPPPPSTPHTHTHIQYDLGENVGS